SPAFHYTSHTPLLLSFLFQSPAPHLNLHSFPTRRSSDLKDQRVYTFFPLYSQEACQYAKAQSFIKRIYGGTFKSMLVQFIQEDSLSEEDIKDLRSILDEKTKKKRTEK